MAKKNRFDEIVEVTVAKMLELLDNTPEEENPFDSKKLTKAEQLQNYMATRDDPMAAREVVNKAGVKGAIEYAETMERYLQEVKHDTVWK